MFDKVIVGIDGREGGHDAIELARRLAAPGAAVTFAYVYGPHTAAGRIGALALPFEMEAAERLLSEEIAGAGWRVEPAAIYESSIARGLHTLAEERDADLLVVGSSHRGLLGRTLVGNHTSSVLDGPPCSVAIAPRAYATGAPRSERLARIGVGRDGSQESVWALQVARALAAREHAKVRALSVVSLKSIPYRYPDPVQWSEIADQMVLDELHRLSELDGVEGDATYGDPGEELATFSGGLDLLIVGSRGRGPLGRLFAGSTSHHLARHARCPLLVLPRSASSEPRPGELTTTLTSSDSLSR